MRKSVRRVLYRLLPSRLLLPWLFLLAGRKRSKLLREFGYARSVRLMLPVTERDEPLPWIPYCAVLLLMERLQPDLKVLEFGAGYSTMFFMERVASVLSIEHHPQWIARLRGQLAPNVTLVEASPATPEAYTAHIASSPERFDLILVDGIHRVECFRLALDRLTPRGVLILDDSDRAAYSSVFPLAKTAGLRALNLQGHKAGSIGLYRSTLFYRDGNCLLI